MEPSGVQAFQAQLQERLAAGDQRAAVKACEDFELEHCGALEPAVMLPFYRVQLMTYLLDDLVNARWLWERMPPEIKADAEVAAAWGVAQHLWKHELASAYKLILESKWSEPLASLSHVLVEGLRARNLKLIADSHSAIAVEDCAAMLGLPPPEAAQRCKGLGWKEEGAFLRPVVAAQEGGVGLRKEQLQQLTEYICKLDAR